MNPNEKLDQMVLKLIRPFLWPYPHFEFAMDLSPAGHLLVQNWLEKTQSSSDRALLANDVGLSNLFAFKQCCNRLEQSMLRIDGPLWLENPKPRRCDMPWTEGQITFQNPVRDFCDFEIT